MKKAMDLIRKTSTFHVHRDYFLILYISLPSLYDYDVKMPSHVLQRKYTSDVEISFLFLNVDLLLRDSTLGGFT